jgi:hypothetical protein
VLRSAAALKLALLVPLAVALASPAIAAADTLSVKEARGQIRTATENWAALMDGKAHVGRCVQTKAHLVRCDVVISGVGSRCEMRVSVSRGKKWDAVRARGVRCRSSN